MKLEIGPYQALAGRLEMRIQDVGRVVQRVSLLMKKAEETADDGYLDGVALNLHSFYTGMESCFEEIARTIDGALPSGSNWHQELLQQMSADLRELRPAVIRRSTRDCLDEYRAFRHLVRNVYTFNLKPERLKYLASDAGTCFEDCKQDIESFLNFLRALSQQSD
ncbi:hypothetical protein [Desulfonatronovibrio magnus]|uniref:ribonuclease toxin HepT-like protein n=1 Tax=Desulfonatronovibrio magnus TaxID=698827 RepID=UPI0005EBCF1F|nr:hypothetical protein [Desulfonatronovibrio magnus]